MPPSSGFILLCNSSTDIFISLAKASKASKSFIDSEGPVPSSSALSEDADDDDRVNLNVCFFKLEELERRSRESSSSSLPSCLALLDDMCKGQRKQRKKKRKKEKMETQRKNRKPEAPQPDLWYASDSCESDPRELA